MVEESDIDPQKNLVELAEGNISGNAVTNQEVAKALEPICSNPVFSETFDIALSDVGLPVALKVRSWLEWYLIHQELETSRLPRFFEKFFTAGQIVCLSGLFALVFLYDSTTSSFIALDAKIAFTIYGLAGFTVFGQIYGNMVNLTKIRGEVGSLILNSINRIHTNQRERS